MHWKWALAIILTIISLAGGVSTYHAFISYIEPRAHAAEVADQLEQDIAMVAQGFQEHLVWEAIRQVKKEMRSIADEEGTSDPILMEEESRERFRELEDELEYLRMKQGESTPTN